MNAPHAMALNRFLMLPVLWVLGGCTVDSLQTEGRPCSKDADCAPGLFCSSSGICILRAGPDRGGVDLALETAPDAEIIPDLPRPDTRPIDLFLVPEAGCPSPLTRCGSACVNLQTDKKHCSKCDNPCPSGSSDSCVGGKCVCGLTGGECSSALNCYAGKCRCLSGGNCTGCCDGDTCLATGSSQSASKCGKNGESCKACTTKTACQVASCTAGSCSSATAIDGTLCSDGNLCTYTDKCTSGTCAGSPYACKPTTCQASSTCDGKGGCTTTSKVDGLGCDDSNQCTYADKCASGVCKGTTYTCTPGECQATSVCNGVGGCTTTNKADNTTCNDKIACTYGDRCLGGSCLGYSYFCDDSLACTQDTCTGLAAPPAGCSHTVLSGYCKIGSSCYSNGAVFSGTNYPCYQCVSATSQSSWTLMGNSHCVITEAGSGSQGSQNGSASAATFWNPSDVAVDASGKIYVTDRSNSLIRVISAGVVSTLAGSTQGFADGAASVAKFDKPQGLAVDASGTVYVADRYNHRIRKISGGVVSTVAGTGVYGYLDGSVTSATFYDPHDVAVAANGDLYVADTGNSTIRKISSGVVSSVAGAGSSGYQDGSAYQAKFFYPYGLALDTNGDIYVADGGNMRIRLISNGLVTTIAGSGTQGLANGTGASAQFAYPQGVAVAGTGVLYIADRSNHVIRKIIVPYPPSIQSTVSTYAGIATAGFADGPIDGAKFNYPFGIAYAAGKIYIADYDNNRIRSIKVQ